MHEPERDIESSPLAAGQRANLPLFQRGEVEALGQLAGPSQRVGGIHAIEPTLHDQLIHYPEAMPRAVALADVPDPGADHGRFSSDAGSSNPGLARGWWQQGRQHSQRGGLSCAIRSEEGNELACSNVDIDPLHSFDGFLLAGEMPGQPLRVDHSWMDHRYLPESNSVRRTGLVLAYTVRR